MYFKDKNDTNIDNEFDDDRNILSLIFDMINKYKKGLLIFLGIILLMIIMVIIFMNSFKNWETINYLTLNGDEKITIYQGSDYIEFGYVAYDSKNKDLSKEVKVESNLDINKVGEYEISYVLGDIERTRIVKVIEKPKESTFLYLKMLNNSVDVYLKLGEKYLEPGYQVFNSAGKELESSVKITGMVDESKKGKYEIIYTLVTSDNVTISKSRVVYVLDAQISLSLSTNEYTNENIKINGKIDDEYFDYILLPNNEKIKTSIFSYDVSENGKYTFISYNVKGMTKKEVIEVNNIDKIIPNGNCKIKYGTNGSIITVNASDNIGIKSYKYNNIEYTNNVISLSSYVNSASVVVYDNAGNNKKIVCDSVDVPIITKISNDGVIVTVEAKKVNSEIAGYYFSYTNKMPNKNEGYLATNLETIDVVRLTGTTYVWVEDKLGNISSPMKITLGNDVLLLTTSGYSILRGTKLNDYLIQKGWSVEELNKLMARSVRASGLYTKEGAATAAVSLEVVLAQKYKIKIPYWMGGKTNSMGASSLWGMYRENPTFEGYYYYGMDCDGLVNWSYKQTGIDYSSILKDTYYKWNGIPFSKENGDVGDVIKTTGHVAIIIGKTNDSFIVAEAAGEKSGLIISKYLYTNNANYTIVKGERLIDNYDKISRFDYPSGF